MESSVRQVVKPRYTINFISTTYKGVLFFNPKTMTNNVMGSRDFPNEAISKTPETMQGGKEMGKDEELAPIQEAVKNLDVTAFLAEASKMNKNPIKLPEELQAVLKYGMQLLITNPTLQNVNFLLGKLSELGDNESEEVKRCASLVVGNIFGPAERFHKEGLEVPTPDLDQINGFIKKRTDLLNQLTDEGLSSEVLKGKSNQELEVMLEMKKLNS